MIVIVVKICRRFLENIGNFVLSPFNNGKVKLVFVMVIFPLILNAIYFWIVDSILKFSPEESDKEIKELYENPDIKNVENAGDTVPNQNNDEMGENDISDPSDKKEIDSLTDKHPNENENIKNRGNKESFGHSIELPDIEDNKV